MYLLNAAWGFGSDQIPAPQATLMKMVVEGVMGGTLPWVLIFMGVFIAIVVEILGIPVLAFSIGLLFTNLLKYTDHGWWTDSLVY